MRVLGRTTAAAALAGTLVLSGFLAIGNPAAGHATIAARSTAVRQVAYFIQWGVYGRGFYPKNLDTSGAAARLTHVDYAFLNVAPEGSDITCQSGDPWADYEQPISAELSVDGVADQWGEPLNGNFGQLLKLKAKYPQLKVIASLGGWSWSKYFSDAALTAASRQAFVA